MNVHERLHSQPPRERAAVLARVSMSTRMRFARGRMGRNAYNTCNIRIQKHEAHEPQCANAHATLRRVGHASTRTRQLHACSNGCSRNRDLELATTTGSSSSSKHVCNRVVTENTRGFSVLLRFGSKHRDRMMIMRRGQSNITYRVVHVRPLSLSCAHRDYYPAAWQAKTLKTR